MPLAAATTSIPLHMEHDRAELARITLVDWTLGNACNYACSYCPPRLHDGSVAWPDPDRVLAFCDRLIQHYNGLGRELLFQFSGGEPTVYPQFLPLIRHLHERNCKVGVISNASRTVRWWVEALPHLDQAVLTHHIEFVDLNHFIEVARCLAHAIRTHVNITMHPQRFDECLASAAKIAEECPDVTLTLKPLLIDFGSMPYAYTASQRDAISRTTFPIRRTRPIAESRGLMRITYDDGHTEIRKPADLIIANQNHFKGWECQAGVELLAIDFSGNLFRGLCRQGGKIGHIDDENLRLPTGPVTCTRDACHCATDLMTSRHHPIQ
jgi:organic radical activating enzyme